MVHSGILESLLISKNIVHGMKIHCSVTEKEYKRVLVMSTEQSGGHSQFYMSLILSAIDTEQS